MRLESTTVQLTIISREKKTLRSPGQGVAATGNEGFNIKIPEAGVDLSPACPIVGGEEDSTTITPCKDVAAAHGNSVDIATKGSIGSCPLRICLVGRCNKDGHTECKQFCSPLHLDLP